MWLTDRAVRSKGMTVRKERSSGRGGPKIGICKWLLRNSLISSLSRWQRLTWQPVATRACERPIRLRALPSRTLALPETANRQRATTQTPQGLDATHGGEVFSSRQGMKRYAPRDAANPASAAAARNNRIIGGNFLNQACAFNACCINIATILLKKEFAGDRKASGSRSLIALSRCTSFSA